MKKNKGFTLVELLATIAIMGMIMILVTPSIVNLQNNNKKILNKTTLTENPKNNTKKQKTNRE